MAGHGSAHLRDDVETLLTVTDLVVHYGSRRNPVVAVSRVSLDLRRGETLGLVGESGCGKSSTGRAILQMPGPTIGSVVFDGIELTGLRGERLRRVRPRLQMIFQDPISSLNPRRTVREIVAEGRRIWPADDADPGLSVDDILRSVGLDPDTVGDRTPSQLSGGQCQRVSIAHALILRPDLLLCDEPVPALDVSVQAQILNLLDDIKAEFGLTMIFVAHDLGVVRRVSDRIMVMYRGRVCEVGDADQVFTRPAHPYTRLLLQSVPANHAAQVIEPAPNSAGGPDDAGSTEGCAFRSRCPRAQVVCSETTPVVAGVADDQYVACHFPIGPDA